MSRGSPEERLASYPIDPLVGELLGMAGVGLAVIDRDLRYVRVNDALAAMNGLAREAHVGRHIGEVLPESRSVLEPLLCRVLDGEEMAGLRIATQEAGEDRTFRGSFLPIRFGDAPPIGAVAVVVEVGEHGHSDRALRLARERLSLVLEGTGVGIFEWDPATGALRWSSGLGLLWGRERGWQPGSYEALLETIHSEDREDLDAHVRSSLRDGRPYEVEFRVLWPEGPCRWLHARMFVEPGDDGRPARLIGLVSDIHARRLRELATEFLSRAGLELSRSLDVRVTLERVAALAVPELAEWCAVQVAGTDGRLETVAVAHSDPEKVAFARDLERRYPPPQEAPTGAAAVVRTGRAELYPVIPEEEIEAGAVDAEHLRLIRELRMQSAMVVPIVARDTPLGAITFVAGAGGPTYGTDDLELAEELGRRVGLVLDNARAHERLAQLQSVTDVALAHLERRDLLDELLRRIRTLLAGDFAVILLLEPGGETLRVEAALGLEEEQLEGVRIRVGRGVAGTIAAEARPRIFSDLRDVDAQSGYLRERAVSVVGVPLLLDGEVLGVLHVSSARPRVFTEADVELMQLVAERAARALAHARLYEEARSTAIELQRALMPGKLPEIPGATVAARYLPGQASLEVGGDWYDVLRLPNGRYGLVVGDVVGRGVRAAAVMGQLRAALRAYLHSTPDPVAALGQLDALVEDIKAVSFATLLIATYDPGTGAFDLACAGHPPPVLRASDTRSHIVDVTIGTPLGVGRPQRAGYAGVLEPGGMLLGYTDGLLEVRGTDIDARLALLCATLAAAPDDAEAAADHVLDALLAEPGSPDDVALLVVRRSPVATGRGARERRR